MISIDYDRTTRTEKVYDDHRKFTLRIIYDAKGRPATWLPSSNLALVNVSYSSTGCLVGLQRGSMSEKSEFDSFGRILSHTFVDGKLWSFSYLHKVIFFLPNLANKDILDNFGKFMVIYLKWGRSVFDTLRNVLLKKRIYRNS